MKYIKCHKTLTGLIAFAFILISAISSFAGPVTYTYDATNRLIYANDNGTLIEYQYDNVGNLQQRLTRYSVTSSPTSKDFGSVTIGSTSAAQTFTITNAGTESLTINIVSKTGNDASMFSLSADTCSGSTLAPLATCTVQAAFSPSTVGNKSANIPISLSSPAALTLNIPLSGLGVEPIILVSPSSLAFGNVYVTFTSSPQTVTVSNNGTSNLVIGTQSFSGANASEFQIVPPDGCSGQTIAPSGHCTVQVAAAPSSTGQKNASLIIPSNDPVTPSSAVSLSGTAIYPYVRIVRTPTKYFSKLQDAYDDVLDGATIQSQALTFTEDLNVNKHITVRLEGGYNSDFSAVTGQTIVHGQIHTISGKITIINLKTQK